MGLIEKCRPSERLRAVVDLHALRLRYWYLDTDAGRHAQLWAFAGALLVLLVQIVRMAVAAASPEARPEPAQAVVWWVVQLVIAVLSAIIAYALRPKVEAPKPGEANMPTTEDGRAVPEAHGTVWIEDEFMLAYKVVGRVPIKSGGKK
ncbi:MAG TPA: hypothetical protein VGE09_15310 [Pseudoxanthomonas sp.]